MRSVAGTMPLGRGDSRGGEKYPTALIDWLYERTYNVRMIFYYEIP